MTQIEQGFALKEKVADLSAALLERHPRMPGLLQEIHKALQLQPENATLMTEEELHTIVAGLKIQTGVQFATSAVKESKKAGKTSSLLDKIRKGGADLF